MKRLLKRIVENARLSRILLHPFGGRPDLAYDGLGVRNNWSEKTLYLNMGYWEQASSIDEASEAMARKLAEISGLARGDRLLDVGFGFGDQDFFWLRAFDPARIDGVNLSPVQVAAARKRVRDAGLGKRIFLREGDAIKLPYADQSFDKLLALESAFHFSSRARFFTEAFRSLRSGGRIALADLVHRPGTVRGVRAHLALALGCFSWQIPRQNLCSWAEYKKQLSSAGFENIQCRTITDMVILPFRKYLRPRLDQPPLRQRYHPIVRFVAKLQIDLGFLDCLDYLLISAQKPAETNAII